MLCDTSKLKMHLPQTDEFALNVQCIPRSSLFGRRATTTPFRSNHAQSANASRENFV
jgi:hypothetical protein